MTPEQGSTPAEAVFSSSFLANTEVIQPPPGLDVENCHNCKRQESPPKPELIETPEHESVPEALLRTLASPEKHPTPDPHPATTAPQAEPTQPGLFTRIKERLTEKPARTAVLASAGLLTIACEGTEAINFLISQTPASGAVKGGIAGLILTLGIGAIRKTSQTGIDKMQEAETGRGFLAGCFLTSSVPVVCTLIGYVSPEAGTILCVGTTIPVFLTGLAAFRHSIRNLPGGPGE